MTWLSIIVAGILTYLTRMTMVALVSRDMLGDKIKAVLAYVPSAVFPAIIFPGIFINDYGQFIEMDDPKICSNNCCYSWLFFKKYYCNNFSWISFLLVFNICCL